MSAVAEQIAAHGVAHGADSHDAHDTHDTHNAQEQLRNNRLGLWLFFVSEAFLFGGLLAVRFYLWGETRAPVDQIVGLIVTSVLLISSLSMNLAETAMENGDRRTFSIGLIITAILGTIFLVGVMIFEWGIFPGLYKAHETPWDNVYGA